MQWVNIHSAAPYFEPILIERDEWNVTASIGNANCQFDDISRILTCSMASLERFVLAVNDSANMPAQSSFPAWGLAGYALASAAFHKLALGY
jgi:hypothetical protein